jgi:hypothetical protein
MNRSSQKLLPTFILFLIGMIAFIFTLWRLDRPLHGSWTAIIISMGVFFVSMFWGFIRLLQWRDNKRIDQFIQAQRSSPPPPPRPELEGTIYGLYPGRNYRVIKSFTDFYENSFQKNEVLHFKERHFLPYDGGHTIVFEERMLYLQENKNKDILDNFSEYIVPFI